jgi:hypothetical protein
MEIVPLDKTIFDDGLSEIDLKLISLKDNEMIKFKHDRKTIKKYRIALLQRAKKYGLNLRTKDIGDYLYVCIISRSEKVADLQVILPIVLKYPEFEDFSHLIKVTINRTLKDQKLIWREQRQKVYKVTVGRIVKEVIECPLDVC